MPKSVMFVIFLLLAALGASLTLVTGEASPARMRDAARLAEDVEEMEEPEGSGSAGSDADEGETGEAENADAPDAPVEPSPFAAGLAALSNADASPTDRLAAAKALLAQLDGSDGQAALMTQASELEAALAADPGTELPDAFVQAISDLVDAFEN